MKNVTVICMSWIAQLKFEKGRLLFMDSKSVHSKRFFMLYIFIEIPYN